MLTFTGKNGLDLPNVRDGLTVLRPQRVCIERTNLADGQLRSKAPLYCAKVF